VSTNDKTMTTYQTCSPSGSTAGQVTAATVEEAIAIVESWGETVLDVQDTTIIIPDEGDSQARAAAQEDLEAGEAPSPEQVTAFADEAGTEAQAAEVRQAAAQVGIPTRATWKQHGNPIKGWEFFGTQVKAPNPKGIKVAKVQVDPQGITLKTSSGRAIDGGSFGSATKFWAVVPADAERQVAEPKAPKTPRPVAEGRTSAADKLAAALSGDQAHAPAPEGYEIRWPKPAFDLLKRTDGWRTAHPDSNPWLVRCNAHGTTTKASDTKEGDKLGSKAGRLTWCKKCQAEAAKAAAQG
jgi:hypothetical protein